MLLKIAQKINLTHIFSSTNKHQTPRPLHWQQNQKHHISYHFGRNLFYIKTTVNLQLHITCDFSGKVQSIKCNFSVISLLVGCDAEALHQIRTMDRRRWHESIPSGMLRRLVSITVKKSSILCLVTTSNQNAPPNISISARFAKWYWQIRYRLDKIFSNKIMGVSQIFIEDFWCFYNLCYFLNHNNTDNYHSNIMERKQVECYYFFKYFLTVGILCSAYLCSFFGRILLHSIQRSSIQRIENALETLKKHFYRFYVPNEK